MMLRYLASVFVLLIYSHAAIADVDLITKYQYPFKGAIQVKMRLADFCDEKRRNDVVKKRGIPESSPNHSMMINMMKSQCDTARLYSLKDSLNYEVKGKTRAEAFDNEIVDDIEIFNITMREYISSDAFTMAWMDNAKMNGISKKNDDYILVASLNNSAFSFLKVDNMIIQIDLTLKNGNVVDNLDNFTQTYNQWLKNQK